MIIKSIPVLPAINIPETILFYRDKLNFEATLYPDYLVVRSGQLEIHFYKTPDPSLCKHSVCLIWVNNIEDFFLHLAALDIMDSVSKLEVKSLGTKEFILRDNNGNSLRFAQQGLYGTVNKYQDHHTGG